MSDDSTMQALDPLLEQLAEWRDGLKEMESWWCGTPALIAERRLADLVIEAAAAGRSDEEIALASGLPLDSVRQVMSGAG